MAKTKGKAGAFQFLFRETLKKRAWPGQ